jgi:hypothetical protein
MSESSLRGSSPRQTSPGMHSMSVVHRGGGRRWLIGIVAAQMLG